MDRQTAQTQAGRVSLRAATLGLVLTNKEDPDCGELGAECVRRGVLIGAVLALPVP